MYIGQLLPGDHIIINTTTYEYVGTKMHEGRECYAFKTTQNGILYEKFFLVGLRNIENHKISVNDNRELQWEPIKG